MQPIGLRLGGRACNRSRAVWAHMIKQYFCARPQYFACRCRMPLRCCRLLQAEAWKGDCCGGWVVLVGACWGGLIAEACAGAPSSFAFLPKSVRSSFTSTAGSDQLQVLAPPSLITCAQEDLLHVHQVVGPCAAAPWDVFAGPCPTCLFWRTRPAWQSGASCDVKKSDLSRLTSSSFSGSPAASATSSSGFGDAGQNAAPAQSLGPASPL